MRIDEIADKMNLNVRVNGGISRNGQIIVDGLQLLKIRRNKKG